MKPEAVLRTLAELSRPSAQNPTNVFGEFIEFAWLADASEALFRNERVLVTGRTSTRGQRLLETGGVEDDEKAIDRLLARGSLHKTEQLLRVGAFWVAGTVEVDGQSLHYCTPLASVPVARAGISLGRFGKQLSGIVKTGLGDFQRVLEAVGDVTVTPLIEDAAARANLLESFDQSERWAHRALGSLGLEVTTWGRATRRSPADALLESSITLYTGLGLYIEQAAPRWSRRGTLMNLATKDDIRRSAFAALYAGKEIPDATLDDSPRETLRPLSKRQASVVQHTTSAPLSVISGAPGTGKTHVLSTVALNAIARGDSVLVVSGSSYAADVIIEHFAACNSVAPIAFGNTRHGRALAAEITERLSPRPEFSGQAEGLDLFTAEPDERTRLAQLRERLRASERQLLIEQELLHCRYDPDYRDQQIQRRAKAGDLDELVHIIDRYFLPRPLDLVRNHAKTIEERLDLDISEFQTMQTSHEELRGVLEGHLDYVHVIEAVMERLSDLDNKAAQLAELDAEITSLRAQLLDEQYRASLSKNGRSQLSDLAGSMLVGRQSRATTISRIPHPTLTAAAPLWVGTTTDVDELLPPVPGMFDLVILDEAAQVCQTDAAGSLFRAKRALVCGDPKQLRHDSSVDDDHLHATTAKFATDPDLLNIRDNSALNVFQTRVPSHVLDEHFRSAPHLIEFSGRRFYDGYLKTATRHPVNAEADHIHVEIVPDGERTGPKSERVNLPEIARAIRVAERAIVEGCRSIGFLSPFRAQADALEAAILDTYSYAQIEEYGLRVGTAHSFQGDERDLMILSWAIGADEKETAWRYLNQASLFNVMVTRARDQVVVVTSNPAPPGLAGEYVRWAEPLSDLIADEPINDPWTREVVTALNDRGVSTRTGYRVGSHAVDVVVGTLANAMAVDCREHDAGREAHLERLLMLQRAGWQTTDCFELQWEGRVEEFVGDLLAHHPDLAEG